MEKLLLGMQVYVVAGLLHRFGRHVAEFYIHYAAFPLVSVRIMQLDKCKIYKYVLKF